MARINLNRVVISNAFVEVFHIVRYGTTKDAKGRTVNTPTTLPDQYGAVAVASPNDLRRLPDYEFQSQVLSIVTNSKVQGVAPGFQPDHIMWRGVEYIVIDVGPYPQYGPGFWQVLCEAYQAVPPAQ